MFGSVAAPFLHGGKTSVSSQNWKEPFVFVFFEFYSDIAATRALAEE
jgi:hypothetical protein